MCFKACLLMATIEEKNFHEKSIILIQDEIDKPTFTFRLHPLFMKAIILLLLPNVRIVGQVNTLT